MIKLTKEDRDFLIKQSVAPSGRCFSKKNCIDCIIFHAEEEIKITTSANCSDVAKEILKKSITQDIDLTHPNYYTFRKIEVWDAIADWELDYFRGCAIKYIARAGKKDQNKEIEDLKKAINYLNKKIQLLENKNENIKN